MQKRTLPALAMATVLAAATLGFTTGASAAPSRTTLTLACDRGASAAVFLAVRLPVGDPFPTDLECGPGSRRNREVDLRAYEAVDVISFSVTSPDGTVTPCPGSTGNALPYVEDCGPRQGGARLTVR